MRISIHNPYLTVSGDTKGGGLFQEDPASVPNIVLQTAAGEPDEFESRLADGMMEVFGAGSWELDQIVAGLNARGCFDRDARLWTSGSLQTELAQLASRLFGTKQ